MAKFIKIKDSLINVDKVTNFELSAEEIWVFFDDGSNPLNIFCANEYEARLIFEDIPHLIDSSNIPAFVREQQLNELKLKAQRAEAKAVINAMDDSNWDELPF
jgi:hypothetical protein